MMSLYGGLFFIGITLGLLFLVATVLIIINRFPRVMTISSVM